MSQEGFDITGAKLGWVLLVVKQDVLPDPVAVCLFGSLAEMPATADDRDLIKQTGLLTP